MIWPCKKIIFSLENFCSKNVLQDGKAQDGLSAVHIILGIFPGTPPLTQKEVERHSNDPFLAFPEAFFIRMTVGGGMHVEQKSH